MVDERIQLERLIQCEKCGKYFPKSKLRKCPKCGIILCGKCRIFHKC